ncbi:MAG: hypothetical protein R2714_03375 [Microthrixaceae bacterium]
MAITLITIDSVGGNTFDPVRNTASDVFSPIGDGVAWVSTPFRNAWAGITGYGELKEENARLNEQLTELRAESITDDNIREQYERLAVGCGHRWGHHLRGGSRLPRDLATASRITAWRSTRDPRQAWV